MKKNITGCVYGVVYSTTISINIRSEWNFWQLQKERGTETDKTKAFLDFVKACELENKHYSAIDDILYSEKNNPLTKQ